jgi:hypothetical protein
LEELKDKFRTLASSLFREERIEKIIDTVESLEELADVSHLTGLLKQEYGTRDDWQGGACQISTAMGITWAS